MTTRLNKVQKEHLETALRAIATGAIPAELKGGAALDGDRGYLTDALDGKLDAEGLEDALLIADEYLGRAPALGGVNEPAPDAHLEMAYEDRFELE